MIKKKCKPDELLSVRPAITGVASGIVNNDGAIAIRRSSDDRFRLGVVLDLSDKNNLVPQILTSSNALTH